MYLSSGRGRKSGGARATGATPSLAPLYIRNNMVYNEQRMVLSQALTSLYLQSCIFPNKARKRLFLQALISI